MGSRRARPRFGWSASLLVQPTGDGTKYSASVAAGADVCRFVRNTQRTIRNLLTDSDTLLLTSIIPCSTRWSFTILFSDQIPSCSRDQTIGGSSAGGGTTPVAQEAVGVVDGENTVFTFVASTLSQPVIMVYAGGTFQSPTIDYPAPTLVDGLWTIDFNTPPNSGPIMVVVFI